MIDIRSILKGKTIILCLGNPDRGDDGAGPAIANAIKESSDYEVIDAGMTPENYTGIIIKSEPDTIIIIDAVLFEGKPGDVRLFSGEDLRSGKISTHDVSPKLLIQYLKESIRADIYILGIHPKSNKLGEGLSEEVKKAVGEIILHLTPA
ncbi:MAG: hydrogenase 3 maturation endopeptidase HyCI [Candidatus Omnitrophota bacterium]